MVIQWQTQMLHTGSRWTLVVGECREKNVNLEWNTFYLFSGRTVIKHHRNVKKAPVLWVKSVLIKYLCRLDLNILSFQAGALSVQHSSPLYELSIITPEVEAYFVSFCSSIPWGNAGIVLLSSCWRKRQPRCLMMLFAGITLSSAFSLLRLLFWFSTTLFSLHTFLL